MHVAMRMCAFIALSLVLSCFSARGQGPAQAPGATSTERVPAGLYIHVVLKSDLSTKYSKVGDQVELEVVRSPIGHDFQSVLTEHTRLKGTVIMVRRSSKDQNAAVAIHVSEAHSKSGSRSLDGTLSNPVLIIHDSAAFPNDTSHSPNSVQTGEVMAPLEGASVDTDPQIGGVLSSKHDFFLVKNHAQLVILTQ
jgi:hypothetical protein